MCCRRDLKSWLVLCNGPNAGRGAATGLPGPRSRPTVQAWAPRRPPVWGTCPGTQASVATDGAEGLPEDSVWPAPLCPADGPPPGTREQLAGPVRVNGDEQSELPRRQWDPVARVLRSLSTDALSSGRGCGFLAVSRAPAGAGPARSVELVSSRGSNSGDAPVLHTPARAPSASGTWGARQARVHGEGAAHRAGRDRGPRGRAGLCPQTRGHLHAWPAASCARAGSSVERVSRWERGAGGGLRGPQRVVATGPSSSGLPCGGPSGGQSVLCLLCRLLVDLSGGLRDPRTRPGAVWHGAWSRLGRCRNHGERHRPPGGRCAQAGAAAVGLAPRKAVGGVRPGSLRTPPRGPGRGWPAPCPGTRRPWAADFTDGDAGAHRSF